MTPTEILAAAKERPVGPMLPARQEWLEGWTGPVEWLDTFRNPEGIWRVSAYGNGGMANGADSARIRLDTRRREVQHLLVDRLNLPEWQRTSEWCAALVWWAGVTGRRIVGVLNPWNGDGVWHERTVLHGVIPGGYLMKHEVYAGSTSPGQCSQPSWTTCGHTSRLLPGKESADRFALSKGVALLDIIDNTPRLTLPPIVADGPPIIWSPT